MGSLIDLAYSDIKSIYDFLEIRKDLVSNNPEEYEPGEIHELIRKQKIVWLELYSRTDNFDELKCR